MLRRHQLQLNLISASATFCSVNLRPLYEMWCCLDKWWQTDNTLTESEKVNFQDIGESMKVKVYDHRNHTSVIASPGFTSKSQTPLYGHRLRTPCSYEHHQRTPPTDKNLPHPNILICRDVGSQALRCGKFVVELLWACPLVVSVAGVRSRCPCSGVWL